MTKRPTMNRSLVLLSLSWSLASGFGPKSTRVSLPRQAPKQLQMAVSYESLMEKLPSKPVIDAVDSVNDGKVVASDVAAAAGVSLSQARKDLTALASITQGDIAVSRDGELIYEFPRNINSVLSKNSAKYKALATFRKAWPALFYGIRVGFGVVLLASLAAIFSTIFFLQSSSSSDNDRRRDNRGFGGGGMGFGYDPFWGPNPFDVFFYRPYYGYYYTAPGEPMRDPEEMGFLESIYSYIFGDGNPNHRIEEERLRLVANMIRENNGAVVAEQLAPFCDDAPKPSFDNDSSYVDESFVLPIVSQLNGEPRVTEDGDIVYVFDDLQMSAGSNKRSSPVSSDASILKRAGLPASANAREIKQLLNLNGINTRGALEKKDLVRLLEKALPPPTPEEEQELMYDDPTMLQERLYKFSLASDLNKFLAGALGVVNLGGALYLGNMFSSYALYGVRLPSYFGLVQAGYPFLLAYAVLFNVIPLVRSFVVKSQNEGITKRNKLRRLWKSVVEKPVGRLARKLKARKKFSTKLKQLGANDNEIIYDTKQDIQEVEQVRQKSALEDFDRLLEEDNTFQ